MYIEGRGKVSSSIAINLIETPSIQLKFKIKLLKKSKTGDRFYCQDYEFNDEKYTVLSSNSLIEIIITNDSNKDYISIDEGARQRVIRKLYDLAKWVDGHLSGDIDMLTTTSMGTKLRSNISEAVIETNKKMKFIPFYNAEECKIQIAIQTDTTVIAISLNEFLNLFYKIKDIDFTSTAIGLMNYESRAAITQPIKIKNENEENISIEDKTRKEFDNYQKKSINWRN